jgi:hypothetical protein
MAVFRWRHFAGEIILWAVRWYVTVRRGPSSAWLEDMACLGTGADSGVCTSARDGAYGAGSYSHRPRTAAAVQP